MTNNKKEENKGSKVLSRRATAYITAVGINALGLFPASLILYLAGETLEVKAMGPWFPPLLYAAIQLIDALFALAFGLLYDKYKFRVLFFPFTLSILIPFLAFQRSLAMIVASAVVFGLVLGSQESVYRAAVGDLTDPSVRATAYGVFSTMVGLGSLGAGALYGLMIDLNAPIWLSGAYVLATQLLSVSLLAYVSKTK
jgi:hypothetical protein